MSHFLKLYSEANERYVVHIHAKAAQALSDYHWPGNVRELQNYIERAVVLAESDELTLELLPPSFGSGQPRTSSESTRRAWQDTILKVTCGESPSRRPHTVTLFK